MKKFAIANIISLLCAVAFFYIRHLVRVGDVLTGWQFVLIGLATAVMSLFLKGPIWYKVVSGIWAVLFLAPIGAFVFLALLVSH